MVTLLLPRKRLLARRTRRLDILAAEASVLDQILKNIHECNKAEVEEFVHCVEPMTTSVISSPKW